MGLIRWPLLCIVLLAGPDALGARLEIALRVPLAVVGEALSAQVYREGPCRYLNLERPQVEAVDGTLRLTSPGAAALGVEVLGKCQNVADWRGSAEFTLAPRIDAAGVLRVRIVDSKLKDAQGSASAAGFIWELSKRQVHPRLERFAYDLGASRAALLALLRAAAPPGQSAVMERALRQLEVAPLRVESAHVVVPIAIEIADAWLAPPPAAAASAAPLTEAELEALENALAPWDAFLAYSVRQIAGDATNGALRHRLFTLLLDSRYRLTEILSGDATPSGDPVRALFIDTWNELRAILADTQHYALFIDAGDALVALDKAAPGLAMRVSADGLRTLARSLRPGETGDPLAFDWSVDPQLRQLFDVEDVREPESRPRSSRAFFVRVAQRALDHWVPAQDELDLYEERIGALLQGAAAAELQRANLAAPYAKSYGYLVPTTALIESCWRQYVVRAGKVSYLRSASSSVGIMQINQRVWRGFYDVERLRWDTRYNIRAGTQILMRYVKDYAIPYAERSGNSGHMPRAAYAVYNAGPRAVGRFDKPKPHPREARVDDKLWTLYQSIAAGAHVDLKTCGVRDPG